MWINYEAQDVKTIEVEGNPHGIMIKVLDYGLEVKVLKAE